MDVHKNVPLTPARREITVGRVIAGQTPKTVTASFEVCVKTATEWDARVTSS